MKKEYISNKLTLSSMRKIYKKAHKLSETEDILIGYLGNIPIYSNPSVPEGMVYILDSTWKNLVGMEGKNEKT